MKNSELCSRVHYFLNLSQSRRLPLLQVVSNNKSFSVGVQSPTEINAPRGCAVILRRICQLSLTRITHQVSRAFDLNSIIHSVCYPMMNKRMHRLQTRFEINCTPEFSTKGRCVQVPIWSLVHPPKFQWCHASRFFEHGNKMTGIGKTSHTGNVLNLQVCVDQ